MSEMERESESKDPDAGDGDGTDVPRTGEAWLAAEAKRHGVETDDLLLLSSNNAPDEMGGDTDHKQGRWFKELWEYATASRTDPTIHIRGVHYATVMRDEEIESATPCHTWTIYQNTDTCFSYLKGASKAARILGYVPMNAIVDEKNTQRELRRYGEHTRDPDPQVIESPAVVQAPEIPRVEERARLRFETPEDVINHVAAEAAQQLADQLVLSRERLRPYHIELWSEKTLPSDVIQTAQLAGVNATVQGEGDLSYTVANDFVERVNDAGKPAIVLYLSDFDPAGVNMPNAMASKICWLNRDDRLEQRAMVERQKSR